MKKRILCTGACGFVGHHAVEHILKNTDWEIVILDMLTYAGNLNRVTEISVYDPKRVKFVWHDLKAPISEMTHNMIGELDYVIHFAAESHVDRSLEDAIPFAQSNVVGTTNLLQYIKEKQPQLKKYIGFNTDEVFGPAPDGVFYKETDKFHPSNPYAAAKCGQWAMEYSFAHAYKMPIIMVHCMNIIGERQHPEKFLPLMIRKSLKREKLTLHGKDKFTISSRCWIHARNVADGLLFLLEKGKTGETYNIVGEEETVWTIADWIHRSVTGAELQDKDVKFIDFHSARPGHDRRYALSGEKLKKLGWEPPITLKKSVKKTVKWSLKHRDWL